MAAPSKNSLTLFGGKMKVDWEKHVVYLNYVDCLGKLQVNAFRPDDARLVASALLDAADRASEKPVEKKRKITSVDVDDDTCESATTSPPASSQQ